MPVSHLFKRVVGFRRRIWAYGPLPAGVERKRVWEQGAGGRASRNASRESMERVVSEKVRMTDARSHLRCDKRSRSSVASSRGELLSTSSKPSARFESS